jgi:hypothetical protein
METVKKVKICDEQRLASYQDMFLAIFSNVKERAERSGRRMMIGRTSRRYWKMNTGGR